jgi:hypothetical protein
MTTRPLGLLGLGAVTAVVVIACGSNGDGSAFGGGTSGSAGSSGDGTSGTSGTISGTSGGTSGASGTSGTTGGIGPACATSTATGKADPVYLVFVVDRSGSMKFNPQPNNKWDSVLSGMTTFFKDTGSAGLFASEQVFPQKAPSNDECTTANYQAQLVPMTALPDTTGVLASTLTANGPDPNFGTPTKPALDGAIAFAKTVQATGKKTALVLVTDGEPNNCNSDLPSTAAAAGAGLPDIKTYVIGVGDLLTNLDQIAMGGGTTKALIVSTTNPAAISGDFVKVLGGIRTEALKCEYPMGQPPNGEMLDINKVNVQFTPKGGMVTTLDYSAGCASGSGWKYDDPAMPTKIIICPTSCNTLLASAEGKIDIVFGCKTAGGTPR